MRALLRYIKLAGVFAAAFILMTVIGYFVAEKKSEPVYLSKIDRLMYDNHNKSPRYVITLPDVVKKKPQDSQETAAEPGEKPAEEAAPGKIKPLTLDDILLNVPSIYNLPGRDATQKLSRINYDDNLTESLDGVILPKISKDGHKPWVEYGNAVKVSPEFKKVAIVIKGMGFDETALDKLSKGLYSEISFSYSPYAPKLGTKILPARQYGHETYMDLLLSSRDFLKSDSGPLSMSLTISPVDSLRRLHKTLSTEAPIGGVVVNDGVADESNREVLTTLLEELNERGLLMIDATRGEGIDKIEVSGLARRKADILIDDIYDREMIRAELQKAEKLAFERGQVLIVINPKPVIVTEVMKWVATFSAQLPYEQSKNMVFEKPLALVPVSNLVVE